MESKSIYRQFYSKLIIATSLFIIALSFIFYEYARSTVYDDIQKNMLNHAKQIQISSIAVNSFTPILNDNLTINLTTNEQLKNLYNTSKNCYWCGIKLVKENTHLDHLMPFKLGGKHTISNLVLACCKCNLKKQGKDPLEFAKTLDESLLITMLMLYLVMSTSLKLHYIILLNL